MDAAKPLDRVARIVDLFSEGAECYLGDDPEGNPVVVWVNKLNSFESEEARMDASVRRGGRMAQLGKTDSPERSGVLAEMSLWEDEALAERVAESRKEEVYLEAINELAVDPEQRERLDRIQRMPQILADAGAAPDDPRYDEIAEDSRVWMAALAATQEKLERESIEDAKSLSRKDLENAYFETWRQKQTLDVFMKERRTTQLWFSMRECNATDVGTDVTKRVWDHEHCDHSKRLMASREQVTSLPDQVVIKVIDSIDLITMSPREAGNSDAPASSSASLERSSVEAAESTLSTPVETPPVAPMS